MISSPAGSTGGSHPTATRRILYSLLFRYHLFHLPLSLKLLSYSADPWVDGCCICCSMTDFSSSRFSYQISGSRSCLWDVEAWNCPLPTSSFRCRKLICLDPNYVGVSVWMSADSTNLDCLGLCDIHDSERRSLRASVRNEQIIRPYQTRVST